jgi:hypothetical protein
MDDRDPWMCHKYYDPEETSNTILIAVMLVSSMAVVLSLLIFIYVDQKRKANGMVWQIQKSELRFADPPEVVG